MFYAASTEELIELLFYLQVGDGSQRLNSNTYSTTSPKLKDLVMSLGVLLGYKVQENKSWDGNPKHREKYSIYLTANSSMTTKVDKNPEGRNDVSYENFEGKVYCLTVKDNQNFIIRQKGYVYITGNSNPGGVGNAWIKNYFSIVPDPTIYPDKRDAIAAIMQGIKVPFVSTHPTRVFVPSFLEDNPHLDKKEYDLVLENLDAGMKSALRDGNWEARVDSRFNRRTVKYFNLYDGMVQLGPIMHEFNIFTKVFFTVDPAGTVREGMTDQLFGNNAVSWTVISLWGVTKNNDLFFLDMLRFREEIPEVVDKVVSKFRQWKSVFPNVYVKMEVNGVGLGPSQYIRRLGVPVKSISKGKDKIANSTSAQLLMKAGKVYFPTNVEWIEEAEDEIFNWSGLPIQTDDIIDTFSDAANEVGPIEDVISQDENVEKTPKLSSLTYRLQRFEPSVTLLSSSKKPYPLKRLVV
jgi:predicted phage terminase large subunit-like protein